ncbi:MAG: hypothetical protein K2Y51_11140 [Gammaproteobacteria bacterium]|nr:hypothetical protein [Gammaproteobacteria bacterium]
MTFYSQLVGSDANGISDALIGMLIGLAAVGVVSMAVVEILKACYLKALFNSVMFRLFIQDRSVRKTVASLAVGGGVISLYSLNADVLVQRLQEIIQSSLFYPTAGNKRVVGAVLLAQRTGDERSALLEQFDKDWEMLTCMTGGASPECDAARERVMQIAFANLKGLQIRLTDIWELMLKMLAIATSIVLIMLFIKYRHIEISWKACVFAVFGGMIAPVAHDLLSMVRDKRIVF